jgi:hypothetical protein
MVGRDQLNHGLPSGMHNTRYSHADDRIRATSLMPESLSEVRDRIHRKANDYFVLEFGRSDPKNWKMFYGATDALLDASAAAGSYADAVVGKTGVDLLACYGFLQAVYIEQDAVRTLSQAVGLNWDPNDDLRLREIRDARNRLTGHPAHATQKGRLSSAIIPYNSIRKSDFRGHVYYEDGVEDVGIDVSAFLNDNEERLAAQLLAVEDKMDCDERQFRTTQVAQPFSQHFGTGFSYLVQRLWCDLNDESRVIQAQSHAAMIRETVTELRDDLEARGFGSIATACIDRVTTGLGLLEAIIARGDKSPKAQQEYDVIFDGTEKSIKELVALTGDLDSKIKTPV